MTRLAILIALILSVVMVDFADAWPRRRRRNYTNNYTYSQYDSSSHASVYDAAYWRASQLASKGYGHHFSLPCNGATGEGWGMGATAAAAIGNCCYWGRPVAAQAAVWSERSNCYFAIRLYY